MAREDEKKSNTEKVDQSIIERAHRYAYKGVEISNRDKSWQGIVSVNQDIKLTVNTPDNKTTYVKLAANTPINCNISMLMCLIERVVQDNFKECPNMNKDFYAQDKRSKKGLMLEILDDSISPTSPYLYTDEYKREQAKQSVPTLTE